MFRIIDLTILMAASISMILLPASLEKVYTKASTCGCVQPEEGEDEPTRTTANVRIIALENYYGWKQGQEFRLEAADGSYLEKVAITSETTKKFQHVFANVPLKKALIFYTPSGFRSSTYYSFRLEDTNVDTFEITGTGFSYPCGLVTCITWEWMGP